MRLVQFGEGRADTRRQQPFVELGSAADEPAAVTATVQHLAANRLLTLGGAVGSADRTVDLAHEALIAGWPTLRGWLVERREAEQTRRRLEARAAEWRQRVKEGRAGGLLDEAELAEAERWLDGPGAADLGFGADLQALVEASRAAIDEASRRELAQARALAGERARAEGEARIAQSRELAAQATNLAREQPDLALLLAHEAGRIADTFESRSGLLAVRLANPHLESFLLGARPQRRRADIRSEWDDVDIDRLRQVRGGGDEPPLRGAAGPAVGSCDRPDGGYTGRCSDQRDRPSQLSP